MHCEPGLWPQARLGPWLLMASSRGARQIPSLALPGVLMPPDRRSDPPAPAAFHCRLWGSGANHGWAGCSTSAPSSSRSPAARCWSCSPPPPGPRAGLLPGRSAGRTRPGSGPLIPSQPRSSFDFLRRRWRLLVWVREIMESQLLLSVGCGVPPGSGCAWWACCGQPPAPGRFRWPNSR